MPMRSMEELNAWQRNVRASLSEARCAAKRARHSIATEFESWKMSPFMERVCLISFTLADYKPDVALQYLSDCARLRSWPTRAPAELVALIEDTFLQCDCEFLASLTDDMSPIDGAAFALAWKYFREWQVVTWAIALNTDRGVAPSTGSILQRSYDIRAAAPVSAHLVDVGTAHDRRGRRWAARLRERWGGRYANIPASDHVDPTELRDKVCFVIILPLIAPRLTHVSSHA